MKSVPARLRPPPHEGGMERQVVGPQKCNSDGDPEADPDGDPDGDPDSDPRNDP